MPLDVSRPFTRRAARAAGLTDGQLRGPQFQTVFHGIHLGARVPLTPRRRAEAALLLHPAGAFASHFSAARLLAVPVPTHADEHVTVPRAADRRRTRGLRSHVAADTSGVVLLDGLRLSSPARLFVEMGTLLDLVDLVVMGDHLVAHAAISPEGLLEHCGRSGIAGARAARRAAAFVRSGVDSPMESRLRMLLVLGGLPEPEINVVVRDRDGVPLRRYDLSYPVAEVAVEYDGRHHVERVSQWERDLGRREAIDDSGWRLLVVTARDLYSTPDQTLRRVHQLLRAARRMPDVPPRLSPTWRPHFPGRS